jgi:hypothetical protein
MKKCQAESATMWRLGRVSTNSRCLANILSFVIQNLTQYIHRTSCTFKNDSQLNMYSSYRKSVLPISEKQCGNIIRKRAYWFKAAVTLSTTPSISERAKGFSMNV